MQDWIFRVENQNPLGEIKWVLEEILGEGGKIRKVKGKCEKRVGFEGGGET